MGDDAQALHAGKQLFWARVPKELNEDSLAKLFGVYGVVEDVVIFRRNASQSSSKGCGLVTMQTHEQAAAALAGLHDKQIWGPHEAAMIVRWVQPRHAGFTDVEDFSCKPGQQFVVPPGCDPDALKLYVGNLPQSCTESDLVMLFKAFGEIIEIAIIRTSATRTSQGYGFVWLKTRAQAEAAVKGLNLQHVFQDSAGLPGPLIVRRARMDTQPAESTLPRLGVGLGVGGGLGIRVGAGVTQQHNGFPLAPAIMNNGMPYASVAYSAGNTISAPGAQLGGTVITSMPEYGQCVLDWPAVHVGHGVQSAPVLLQTGGGVQQPQVVLVNQQPMLTGQTLTAMPAGLNVVQHQMLPTLQGNTVIVQQVPQQMQQLQTYQHIPAPVNAYTQATNLPSSAVIHTSNAGATSMTQRIGGASALPMNMGVGTNAVQNAAVQHGGESQAERQSRLTNLMHAWRRAREGDSGQPVPTSTSGEMPSASLLNSSANDLSGTAHVVATDPNSLVAAVQRAASNGGSTTSGGAETDTATLKQQLGELASAVRQHSAARSDTGGSVGGNWLLQSGDPKSPANAPGNAATGNSDIDYLASLLASKDMLNGSMSDGASSLVTAASKALALETSSSSTLQYNNNSTPAQYSNNAQQLLNSSQQSQQKLMYATAPAGMLQQNMQSQPTANNAGGLFLNTSPVNAAALSGANQAVQVMQPGFVASGQGNAAASTLASASLGSQFAVLEVSNMQLQALQPVLYSLQEGTNTTIVLQNSNTAGNALLHVMGSTQESVQTACNLVAQLVGNMQ